MNNLKKIIFSVSLLSFVLAFQGIAQIIPVGSGSYTKTFPGTDAAGRNAYPSGSPQFSGNAVGKPAPTNDWWTAVIKENFASNLFTYPFTLKTITSGLVVSYIPSGVIDDLLPVTVGVTGMAATKTTVSDFSDWTVTMDWTDASHNFKATAGIAMPFLYFTKASSDVAQVTVTSGTVTVSNEMLIITDAKNGADFAVYAPAGSTWTKNAGVYTSTLNGKNYWSLAFIPLNASNVATVATEYKKYAYVFPINTTATYSYNESTSVLRTNFEVQTEVKEGAETKMLIGLLPHQWGHLASDSPVPDKYSYASIRGEIKTLAGNSFSVENTFHGILPTLPYVDNYSTGFEPTSLTGKINAIQNDGLDAWTDSYNEGQMMNRLIQTARIADEMGNTTARDKMVATIKERLEDWLKAESGEVAFLFYYHTPWTTLLGYPGGYGQDGSLNDHHFHWGYFIHAAAFMEQYQPGWAAQWGDMVNMLVRDAASYDRNDPMFPYLRNFSPYAGHCWADGFATFPQGNNQESTSESMQFNSSLIHWGQISGNKTIRDLGIYLYTTEQTAIEEYWFDMHHRTFPATQQYSLVSRVWGNSIDNGTFWTADIAACYGIEMYPIHGGSLYLGQDTVYVKKLWDEIKSKTGIMSNEANANLWHDVMWEYLAFIDPAKAIELYNSYPNRSLKFGITDAQTYHWLHAMNALGRVDATITADYPIAAAFKLNGEITYVAHNYSDAALTVTFSTGYKLQVPARSMATSKDCTIGGELTVSFNQAYTGGSVQLNVAASGGTPSKVEFWDGAILCGSVLSAPYTWNATNLTLGMHSFLAKVYDGNKLNTTNSVDVQVGEQKPYNGSAWSIPGTIEAGKYDIFEGGIGQDISYFDATTANSGDFRLDEYVDAGNSAAEGATIGWIATGEWLEYTVNVGQAGLYSLDFRYASGNANGGGPFHLELDGTAISGSIPVPSTSTTAWDVWATKTVANIPFTPGGHILRVAFAYGEFNLGKMTFTRTGDLTFSYPVAKAGNDIKVIVPASSATLDGSASMESGGKTLTYKWEQVYGPSVIQFSDQTNVNPTVSNLVEGIYKIKLTVFNPDGRSDDDEMLLVVTSSDNMAPSVTLTSPANNASYSEGSEITIAATASDFDGTISQVDFYQNNTLIASDNSTPYSITWLPGEGDYVLTAKAIDNGGAVGTSQEVKVSFSPVLSCTETSSEASQGSFSTGYIGTFTTVGSSVTIKFELLDDKSGLVAYLWNYTSGFAESAMTNSSGKIFTATLGGLETGASISFACKFAFTGGMSVTKAFTYVVGSDCGGTTTDTEIPSGFTASVGVITSNSIELLMNATDNSGKVVYKIVNGANTQTVTAGSGTEKSYIITGLIPETQYAFAISATDDAGNAAGNNPVNLTATTYPESTGELLVSVNALSIGAQANSTNSFDITSNISWTVESNQTWLSVSSTSGSGNATIILTAQANPNTVTRSASVIVSAEGVTGQTVSVTQDASSSGINDRDSNSIFFFPNPVKHTLYLQLSDENNRLVLFDILGNKVFDQQVASTCTLDMSALKAGIYFIRVENGKGTQMTRVIKE